MHCFQLEPPLNWGICSWIDIWRLLVKILISEYHKIWSLHWELGRKDVGTGKMVLVCSIVRIFPRDKRREFWRLVLTGVQRTPRIFSSCPAKRFHGDDFKAQNCASLRAAGWGKLESAKNVGEKGGECRRSSFGSCKIGYQSAEDKGVEQLVLSPIYWYF